ncbi:hypothetical protein AOLI_G00241940 [Acnodon oligacanthus]
MYLERANEDYKKNGTLLTTSKVKADILEKLAETVYLYTAYPSSAQISDVAEALVEKYPCLREPGSFSGYYDWEQSIKYKMANYRTKFRGFGVPELQDEFRRITTVHLESKFMSKLDEYTPKPLVLFHCKGGALGLRLQAILLKFQDADGDSVSQDLAVQEMKIYKIKTETSEGTADFGIVVEGVKVLSDLGNFARACSMLVGFAYVVDLAYPKELRTFNGPRTECAKTN